MKDPQLIAEEKQLLARGCTIREMYTLRAKYGDKEAEEALNRLPPEKQQYPKINVFKLKQKKRIIMAN